VRTGLQLIKNLPYNDKLAFLRSHNFYVIEKAGEDLYENATDLLRLDKSSEGVVQGGRT